MDQEDQQRKGYGGFCYGLFIDVYCFLVICSFAEIENVEGDLLLRGPEVPSAH